MGIFNFIREKKEAFRSKKLEIVTNKAKVLEEKAEKHAKELEKMKEHKKAYINAMNRQNEAKAVIQEAKRMEHPFLYKIGDSVKQKFAEAQKNKTSPKLMGKPQKNIFQQSNVGSSQPYWLKQGNGSNIFTQTNNTNPFGMNNKKRK